MSEKILSAGVYTNEIDQSFIPAALGDIGAAIVGPTVKGPFLNPTVVNSYGEYVNIFGELIESGSDNFQFLTSHTAQEYLRQGGPLTIVRVGSPADAGTRATAIVPVSYGAQTSSLFTLEAIGDGAEFNNFVGSGSNLGTDDLLPSRVHAVGNNQFLSGSFGGKSDNFRWEISQRNLNKGTFTLLIRQGDDTEKKKQILETHSDLSFDPSSVNFILKRIGNQTTTIAVENGTAFVKPVGDFPVMSNYVRVSDLPIKSRTPGYLDSNGNVVTAFAASASFFPPLGSGSFGGAFGGGPAISGESDFGGLTQTAGSNGNENQKHPFAFYSNITEDSSQGIDMSDSAIRPSGDSVGTAGGYATALNMLKNKDEYEFNLLFIPGVIDQAVGASHNSVIQQAIEVCEERTDCFLVYDNSILTSTVANVKLNTEARNSSYAATYYPWIQIQDAAAGVLRYVPPSVVIAGVYHFNDIIGQPWFAPAGLNRGGIDSAVQAYRKLTQANRDDLYDSNSNPIATFPGQGVTVFGQKTTQKKASALDRVNVRRLLINVKTFISRTSRTLVFEQNTSDLRDQFLNVVNPFLDQVQANSGLNAYRVQMDDQNNTPETIDRNQLIGQIFLQPTRTAEFILLDFIVQPTGAAFPE